MPTDPARYFAPFVYLIPAAIALSIAWVLRGKAHQPPARTHYTRVLFWLCLAQGLHNAYYFVATLLRIYDSAAYARMMLPLPLLFVQGIIAAVFLTFGIRFLREKDLAPGSEMPVMATATRSRDLSVTDPRSDLHHRRNLEGAIQAEMKRSSRSGRPFTLMMFDVDRFKTFSDERGQQKGDALLLRIAKMLRSSLRSDVDLPFRCGVTEFLVLLPDTSMGDAQIVAERLRRSVASLPAAGVSLSIGLLLVSPARDAKAKDLVAAVGSALHRAKKEGGDRIAVHPV